MGHLKVSGLLGDSLAMCSFPLPILVRQYLRECAFYWANQVRLITNIRPDRFSGI